MLNANAVVKSVGRCYLLSVQKLIKVFETFNRKPYNELKKLCHHIEKLYLLIIMLTLPWVKYFTTT